MYACADHCADAVQLSGKRAVNVQSVLDHYDPTGNSIRLIGAKIYLLLKEKRRYVQPAVCKVSSLLPSYSLGCPGPIMQNCVLSRKKCLACSGTHSPAVEPAVSYDLQTATLRESNTESTKFYVHCQGASTCTVRTETSYAAPQFL